jgi:uncharacterized membrane protein YhaH (DUF805 family)
MFSGRLSRGEYARAAAMRFGLVIAGMLAIPAALYEINNSNQSCPAEFCGALPGILITFVVMPALYLGLILSLIGVTVRRLRDLELPVVLVVVVPALMLGDLMSAVTLDGFVFDTQTQNVFHPIPGNLLMALACVGFLCVARSETSTGEAGAGRWGVAGALALGVVTFASAFALFKFVSELAVAAGAESNAFFGYAVSYVGASIAPIMLIVMLVLAARSRHRSHAA